MAQILDIKKIASANIPPYKTFNIYCDGSIRHGDVYIIAAHVSFEDKTVFSVEKIFKVPHLPQNNSNIVEAVAVNLALKLASDIFIDVPYSRVNIFTDSNTVVRYIYSKDCGKAFPQGCGKLKKMLRQKFYSLSNMKYLNISWLSRKHVGIKAAHNKCNQLAREVLW